jgi:AcrR family transcriptional regulator
LSGDKFSQGEWEEFTRPPLPRGRHRLTREVIAEHQRRRLIEGMARSVAVRGYASTSVERVIEEAGVSRATFYEHFANRQACLLATHEDTFARLMERISDACRPEDEWAGKAAAAIAATVRFAAEAPDEARLLGLDALAADAVVSRAAVTALDRLVDLLRTGREEYPAAAELPGITEPALVGAASASIYRRLLNGESPLGLEPELVTLVLAPYMGVEEATRRGDSLSGEAAS